MKKIIIYGVYSVENRRKIEFFLGEDCTVIGLMDTYLACDILDGKKTIAVDELKSIEYDYIVISVSNNDIVEEIKKNLVINGVQEKKIINPILFFKNSIRQKNLVNHIEQHLHNDVEVLIFGLSYSLRGIDKEKLKRKSFDFSWHGMDLYYNYKLFLHAKKSGKINGIKSVLLVFPYYYFNHDMSKEKYQYDTAQIISVSQLNDVHNRNAIINSVYDYDACEKMFGKNVLDFYRANENIYIYDKMSEEYKEPLASLWEKEHEDTIVENGKIFGEFLSELCKVSNRVDIIVPPAMVSSIEEANKISKMKQIFENNISKYKSKQVNYIDLFDDDRFQNRELYCDSLHLNYWGADLFTEEINRIIS